MLKKKQQKQFWAAIRRVQFHFGAETQILDCRYALRPARLRMAPACFSLQSPKRYSFCGRKKKKTDRFVAIAVFFSRGRTANTTRHNIVGIRPRAKQILGAETCAGVRPPLGSSCCGAAGPHRPAEQTEQTCARDECRALWHARFTDSFSSAIGVTFFFDRFCRDRGHENPVGGAVRRIG